MKLGPLWIDKLIEWFNPSWDAEKVEAKPSLEERIQSQIDDLKLLGLNETKEISNLIGWNKHLAQDVEKLLLANAMVDAHYVRTMATAFDEKHQAFVSEVEDKANARFDATSKRLRDSEEACEKRCEVLQAQIHDLTGEVAAVAESLRKALARLRAVGEGN